MPHRLTFLRPIALRVVLLFLLAACGAEGQEIRGRVTDAVTGEPLANAQVRLVGTESRTVTDADGRFLLVRLQPGEYSLQVATVGYRPVNEKTAIAAGEIQDFEVHLFPDTLRRAEAVTVEAGAFAGEAGVFQGLSGNELKNLGSVLADDPLRAVQGLPAVIANDDFQGQFALRGAGFERIGIYLDGILLHSPFHTIQGDPTGASLTILQGEMLDGVSLHAGAPPVPLGDRTAGALDVSTRDGDTRRFSTRATGSASNAGWVGEGPLGRRGSWLAAVRKSYLQYIIARTTDDPTLAFGFWDAQGKIAWRLTQRQHLNLAFMDGHSGLDRTEARARLGLNSVITSDYHFSVATLGWRYEPGSGFLVRSRLAYLREKFLNHNRDRLPLAGAAYGEWVWNADASRAWGGRGVLELGWSLRRLRDDGYSNRILSAPPFRRTLDLHRGTGLRNGAYLQQSWAVSERITLTAGARWDWHSVNGIHSVSPQASVVLPLWPAARLHLTWGQAVQYPELSRFTSFAGRETLLPERSTHFQAAIDQTLDERTRVRVEAYARHDRDLLFRPFVEPRLIRGAVFNPATDAPWENSQRGYARGFQVFLQRRSANRFSGWLSYAYGRARLRDGAAGLSFPADYDQRYLWHFFGSYRLRPTVNVSAKWAYGSGLPLSGFFERRNGVYFLSAERNALRLPAYQRADLRLNKAIVRRRSQITLFFEVINVTARDNVRFDDLGGYDSRTGRASVSLEKMFPILPSAGILLHF